MNIISILKQIYAKLLGESRFNRPSVTLAFCMLTFSAVIQTKPNGLDRSVSWIFDFDMVWVRGEGNEGS